MLGEQRFWGRVQRDAQERLKKERALRTHSGLGNKKTQALKTFEKSRAFVIFAAHFSARNICKKSGKKVWKQDLNHRDKKNVQKTVFEIRKSARKD